MWPNGRLAKSQLSSLAVQQIIMASQYSNGNCWCDLTGGWQRVWGDFNKPVFEVRYKWMLVCVYTYWLDLRWRRRRGWGSSHTPASRSEPGSSGLLQLSHRDFVLRDHGDGLKGSGTWTSPFLSVQEGAHVVVEKKPSPIIGWKKVHKTSQANMSP